MRQPVRHDLPVAVHAALVRSSRVSFALSTERPPSQHPALVYLASLAPGSRRTMQQALDVIADLATGGTCDHLTAPWQTLRYAHTQAIRATLAERYTARTANKMLSALRQVLKTAWRLGLMTAEEYQRAADVSGIAVETPSQAESGRHLSPGELMALMSICADGSHAGSRDAALIAVGYGAGLRRSELARLDVDDFDPEAHTLTVRHGKRNKSRVVYLASGALDALEDWLQVRNASFDAGPLQGEAPLFVSILKSDRITDKRMSSQAIYKILSRRGARAGIRPFTPHDLRRTFAGDLLDAGADIVTVQKLMGHSNVQTTAGYDRRDAKAKRAAVAKLHVPYHKHA